LAATWVGVLQQSTRPRPRRSTPCRSESCESKPCGQDRRQPDIEPDTVRAGLYLPDGRVVLLPYPWPASEAKEARRCGRPPPSVSALVVKRQILVVKCKAVIHGSLLPAGQNPLRGRLDKRVRGGTPTKDHTTLAVG
jgi:hypothetical protein